MEKKRAWPSRRLQIGALVVLAVAAALRVFVPPLNPQKRAEQLYRDSWFQGSESRLRRIIGLDPTDDAAAKAEGALKLDPGNSLYEQALVWHTPREKLRALVRNHKLGPEATALAAGLLYQYDTQPVMDWSVLPEEVISDLPFELPEPREKLKMTPEAKLARLDALKNEDPYNAAPYYLKADLLAEMKRFDAALAEVDAGNRLGRLRAYQPALGQGVANSPVVTSTMLAGSFPAYSRCRNVARALSDMAGRDLRRGRVDEARRALEACCRMGVVVALEEPHTLIAMLVGTAVFAIGWARLEPLYKDFGPADGLDRQRRVARAFDQAREDARAHTSSMMPALIKGVAQAISLPVFIACAAGSSLGLVALSLLLWIPAGWVRRRRGEAPLHMVPWGEGRLARLFLAVYLPAVALTLGLAYGLPRVLANDNYMFVWPVVVGSGIVPLVVGGGVGAAGHAPPLRSAHRRTHRILALAVHSPCRRQGVDPRVPGRRLRRAGALPRRRLLAPGGRLQADPRCPPLADRPVLVWNDVLRAVRGRQDRRAHPGGG
ncbi:MAG: hypothetical protein HY321_15685 [Armatimonadetes bacterium]|nr:hypothetical protein [Armatimonadota bacterium]